MARFKILALILFLSACAGSPPQTSGHPGRAPRPASDAATQAESPEQAVEVALSCSTQNVRFCPPRGCSEDNPGFERPAPLTITTPGPGANLGQFCSGDDCRPAYFRDPRRRAGDTIADVWTGEGWSRPEGEILVAGARTHFRLIKPASDGLLVWSGFCQAAGS